ncbi:MAG: zinc ribbon domain-containing protein [Acidimicrobiia bacterium]
MSPLEQLLVVQDHDSAAESLRHRRAILPEREVLARAELEVSDLEPQLTDARGRRDEVAREVKRLDDESSAVTARIKEVEKTMYSGSVSSPRELQAMQSDVEQLTRHSRSLDDRELELMERQEALDAEVGAIEKRLSELRAEADTARGALVEKEAVIDGELAVELEARGSAAGAIPADLLAAYERIRESNHGAGAARLIGNTCQGCRLTIPATEVDRIRRQGEDGTVHHCDNCGAILVPT